MYHRDDLPDVEVLTQQRPHFLTIKYNHLTQKTHRYKNFIKIFTKCHVRGLTSNMVTGIMFTCSIKRGAGHGNPTTRCYY